MTAVHIVESEVSFLLPAFDCQAHSTIDTLSRTNLIERAEIDSTLQPPEHRAQIAPSQGPIIKLGGK